MIEIKKKSYLTREQTISYPAVKQISGVSWLPENSTIDIILFDKNADKFMLAHEDLTTHSFLVATTAPNMKANSFVNNGNKKILLTNHVRRGIQIPGGTKEPEEDQIGCVIREVLEETGLQVRSGYGSSEMNHYRLTSLGFARIHVPSEQSEGSKFPHPYNVMSFFGKIFSLTDIGAYTAPITECAGISIMDVDYILRQCKDINEVDGAFIQHYTNLLVD